MKSILFFILSICAFSAVYATEPAEEADQNPYTIPWNCQATPSCSTQTGTYSQGSAQIGENAYYDYVDNESCCQIAADIWSEICQDQQQPVGVQVTCQ